MKQRTRHILRAGLCALLASATLYAVALAAPTASFAEAARTVSRLRPRRTQSALALLRFERGDFWNDGALSLPAALVLRMTPLLFEPRAEITAAWADAGNVPEAPAADGARETERAETGQNTPGAAAPQSDAGESVSAPTPVTVRDNGVRATTLRPGDATGYLIYENVYVHNVSAAALTLSDLGFDFTAALSPDAPQVLIVHTHGCEAYTMPEGEEYQASDDHRTLDERCNVLRVGDEIARVLEAEGIGVVHDRTLHDYPSYSGAYNRSLATVENYRAKYPSITYVLDVHRDAVADADGTQYKLLRAEEPNAAQLEFVIGTDGGGAEHPRWRENLKLACAVQSTLLRDYPTLLRPVTVRNSRYNQHVTTGSLLVEVGTAGNSLEEALNAAQLFAKGFAETIKGRPEG